METETKPLTRDPKTGFFLPGHPGGPGRKADPYIRAIRDAIGPERVVAILLKFLRMALEDGDVRAGEVVLDRVLGRARQPIVLAGSTDMLEAVREACERIIAQRAKPTVVVDATSTEGPTGTAPVADQGASSMRP